MCRKDLTVVISTTQCFHETMHILKDRRYPDNLIFNMSGIVEEDDPGQYFAPPFMKYEEDGVFTDAGCYGLETSIQLLKYCKCVKKVYAFEPDLQNYQECRENAEKWNHKGVEIFYFGTWSERKNLHFKAKGNDSPTFQEEGGLTISVATIDEFVNPDDWVTMIRMDAEGSELESLKGTRRIILRNKLKLAVCIYHKPEDMTEIPLYIKELVPEYQLYIQHHSTCLMCELVLYAVMP